MSRKVMKLIDPSTGLMQCRVCGSVHWANLRSGGHYCRGSWQCQNGCKPSERSQTQRQFLPVQ